MLGVTKEELLASISQLEQAIHNHNEWFEAINRTLLCRLQLDQRELRPDAHRECRFGQWIYQYAGERLREHPAFRTIEKEHQAMHAAVSAMLHNLDECGAVTADRYDRFANAMKRLRLEINSLKEELQNTLYNLDSLTSANNRIGMLTHLREQRELSRRNNQTFSIVMLDLDHFKMINDRCGHQTGDQVLKTISHYILDNIRPYDRLYRYGGEEFLLSMPQTALDTATAVAERLREGITQLSFGRCNDEPVRITVSFGVAELPPEGDVDVLIQHADKALYNAKH
ncbi:MAG: diguanylate cyclase, partial [Gammaproteobacteria bacterium]|nr:diguanylate cyclase [Gammaproteobacteria bacterium]